MEQSVLGKYRLERRIGSGGMAEVFLATTTGPGGFQKTVALKRILPQLVEDPEFVRMFLNEARLAARLNHPNIVQIYELGQADGLYYIAMEYVDGPSVRALCDRAKEQRLPMPFGLAARIIADACQGLATAHEYVEDGRWLKLIHRDVNPDNILLSRAGVVKIADFGIAKAAALQRLTRVGMIKGKVCYMSPEQLRDQDLDCRVDVFALAMSLYEILAGGVLPWDAPTEDKLMDAMLLDPPVPLPLRRADCPSDLWAIIERAISKDRARRPTDCRVLGRELDRFLLAGQEVVGAQEVARFVAQMFPESDQSRLLPPTERITDAHVPLMSPELAAALDGGPTAPDEQAYLTLPGGKAPLTVPDDFPPLPADELEEPPTQIETLRGLTAERAKRRPLPLGLLAALACTIVCGIGYLLLFSPSASKSAFVERPVVRARPDAGIAAATAPAPRPDAAREVAPDASRDAGLRTDAAAAPAGPDAGREAADAARSSDAPAVRRLREVLFKLPRASSASLLLDSEPQSEAQVDGKLVGVTPVRVIGLPAGVHQVRFTTPENGVSRQLSVKLAPRQERTERVNLVPGILDVHVHPWAFIEIDGKSYGKTPFPDGIPVTEGEHVVRARNPDLKKTKTVRTRVKAGGREIVAILLTDE